MFKPLTRLSEFLLYRLFIQGYAWAHCVLPILPCYLAKDKMLKEIKNPKNSRFLYNPKNNEINIVSELSFYYSRQNNYWMIDKNPYGDPNLIKIIDLKFTPPKTISFTTKEENKEIAFILQSENYYDSLLYQFLIENKEYDLTSTSNMDDKVDLIFEMGKLATIDFIKMVKGKVIESFRIFIDEGVPYYIIENPWKRLKLRGIDIDVKKSSIRVDTEESILSYKIQTPQNILFFIKKLLQDPSIKFSN